MYSFYTQFDKNYLSRALTLHRSLEEFCEESFVHYLVCLDTESYDLLQKIDLVHAVILQFAEIETEELRAVRKTRSLFEYYWTVGPSGLLYVLNTYRPETLAYLDGDMCFYSSPKELYEELGTDSVLLFPHRLGKNAKVSEVEVGAYNVGMMIFRNDTQGKAALLWWRDQCNLWCYDRIEDGKYGDQKYLDEFPTRFSGVRSSNNKGADAALWNIENEIISNTNGSTYISGDKLIFYHFAKLKYYYPLSKWLPYGPLSAYTLPSPEKKYIYEPYFKRLYAAIRELEQRAQSAFPYGSIVRPSFFMQIKNSIGGWFILRKK